MEAGINGTAREAGIEYTECDWGDLIVGTKDQLQALGLGVSLAFPGEPGGPKRDLKALDQRGYSARITKRDHRDGRYTVYLHFPNWPERPEAALEPFSLGVTRRERLWFDEYEGAAADLANANLVRLEHLPGMPGRGKSHSTIYADGTAAVGPWNKAFLQRAHETGARWVTKVSTSRYRVGVRVAAEEEERRRAASASAESQWLIEIRALPRPGRLRPLGNVIPFEAPRRDEARGAIDEAEATTVYQLGFLTARLCRLSAEQQEDALRALEGAIAAAEACGIRPLRDERTGNVVPLSARRQNEPAA